MQNITSNLRGRRRWGVEHGNIRGSGPVHAGHDEAAINHMLAERRRRVKQKENFAALRRLIPIISKVYNSNYDWAPLDCKIRTSCTDSVHSLWSIAGLVASFCFWYCFVEDSFLVDVMQADKASTLVDAITYLKNLQKEIEELKASKENVDQRYETLERRCKELEDRNRQLVATLSKDQSKSSTNLNSMKSI